MKLFVANCTNQFYDFSYVIPGETKRALIRIRPGGQERIPGDFTPHQIDAGDSSIIGRHAKYGVVHVNSIDRNKPFTGICYSVDKPVSVDQIMRVRERNEEVLIERGQQIRREAAVATHNAIEQSLDDIGSPAKLSNLETEIQEDTRTPSDSRMLGEGVRVTRDAPESAPPSITARAPRRRANRAAAA